MEEQEILPRLRAHVARYQSFSPDQQRPPQLSVNASTLDLSNIDRLSAEVWTSRDAVGQINPRKPGFLNSLAQTVKKTVQRSLTWYTRSLQTFHYNVALALQEQANAIASLNQSLKLLEDQMLQLRSTMPGNKPIHASSDDAIPDEPLRPLDLAIQEQQSPYVELFRGLSPVVDIGCGRGEFLELSKERGIDAYGVDSDRTACEVVRRKLLKVVDSDLFDHLRQLPDRSLGGIFSARVIEYLPVHLQIELVSLCSQKVKPRGLVVIETINPESTIGFGRNSNLDPTHLRAVPPELLKSVLESNSFHGIKICFLAPIESCAMPVTEMNNCLNTTACGGRILPGASNSLLGTPAYAAVAWRK